MNSKDLIFLFENSNIQHYTKKTSDSDLPKYLKYCVDHSVISDELLFIEFGVFTGNTFQMIRSNLPDNIKLYGFDTFIGLPEDWMIDDKNILYPKGTFALNYIPNNQINTEFIVGEVQNTIDNFLTTKTQNISLVHFDMDLYNPTFFVLEKIKDKIFNGTILIFDDFYNMPGWENHSFKALLDFINTHNINFEPLATVGWNDGWASAAIKIIS
jgi:hypothetical protein